MPKPVFIVLEGFRATKCDRSLFYRDDLRSNYSIPCADHIRKQSLHRHPIDEFDDSVLAMRLISVRNFCTATGSTVSNMKIYVFVGLGRRRPGFALAALFS